MAFVLTERDHRRLQGVHPDLVKVVEAAAQQPAGVWFMVIEGLRTIERQRELLAQGATTTLKSRHLTGHAVDIAPVLHLDNQGRCVPSWHWPHFHKLAPVIKAVAADLGVAITWGGDFPRFKDGPHWQLSWKAYPK